MNASTDTPISAVIGVIVAAGSGVRMGGVEKAFQPLLGREMVAYSLRVMEESEEIDRVMLVVPPNGIETATKLCEVMGFSKVRSIMGGGRTRRESVEGAVRSTDESSLIVVHDGARPCITTDLITRGVALARETGAAIPVIPAQDTIKEIAPDGTVLATPDRWRLYAAQTPQVFHGALLRRAHDETPPDLVLDDASLVEALGLPVHTFDGDPANIKVTTPIDLAYAEAVLRRRGISEPHDPGQSA